MRDFVLGSAFGAIVISLPWCWLVRAILAKAQEIVKRERSVIEEMHKRKWIN